MTADKPVKIWYSVAMNHPDEHAIDDLLTRGVEEIFVKEHLSEALKSGRKLRIKLGIDPTGPKIHVGRAIPLRKLKAFQDLGHHIVLIIGDFTAQIGDASDKDGKRPMLTKEDIKTNLKEYTKQIGKILDIDKVEFRYNSEWLGTLDFNSIGALAEHFSVQQMLRRRTFSDRFEKGDEISLREFLYPLMQGYDSVAINSDVEIGGFDQLFNLQAGRVLQKAHGMPEQDIMTLQMIEGTDGRKMSTSWGNIITIVDEPSDMYGKILSLHDDLIIKYFTLTTDMSMSDIQKLEDSLKDGANPKELKMQLARELVRMYHGKDAVGPAEEDFVTKFQKKEIPDDISEITASEGEALSEVLVRESIVESKSDWRRLVKEGAVMNLETKEKIEDSALKISEPMTLKVGKKRFIKIKL